VTNVQDFNRIAAQAIEDLIRIPQDQHCAYFGPTDNPGCALWVARQAVDHELDSLPNRGSDLVIGG
jgi:hypothetical protein